MDDVYRDNYTAEFGRPRGSKNGMRRPPTVMGSAIKCALIGGGITALTHGAQGLHEGIKADTAAHNAAGGGYSVGERVRHNGLNVLGSAGKSALGGVWKGAALGGAIGAGIRAGRKVARKVKGVR